MKKWSMPDSYFGATWPDYFVFLGQNRDSDALTQSNFKTGLERLGGETGEDDNGISLVKIVRESHWACGWIEWIAIHQSNTSGIVIAEQIESDLESYPVLDEEDFSRIENEDCEQTWTKCFDAQDRIDYFRRHGYSAQSLVDLFQAIRNGSWYHAANMLNCPSDLLY